MECGSLRGILALQIPSYEFDWYIQFVNLSSRSDQSLTNSEFSCCDARDMRPIITKNKLLTERHLLVMWMGKENPQRL